MLHAGNKFCSLETTENKQESLGLFAAFIMMTGNVRGARDPTVAGCDKGDYDEQIRRIQAHLRHR